MSHGIRIWGDGWVYDTTSLSWMIIDEGRVVGSDRSATLSYPHLAGYGFEAKVIEVQEYDPLAVGFGGGFWYVVQHGIDISYSGGYPTIEMWPGVTHDAFSRRVNIPMRVYVFVR